MKKIGLFYWPKSGNVEFCAKKIYKKFPQEQIELHSVDEINDVKLEKYDLFIVGGSTVGADVWENSADSNRWHDFFKVVENSGLKDKPVAIYGLGDQVLYPDHFVDGIKTIKNEFEIAGAKLIGRWPTEGYEFTGSESVEGDEFLGLALDEDQQDEMTDERIDTWIKQISKEAGFPI
jgi:flavodoxin I